MGLAMVYGIVKNHGGTVRVYSEEGSGTSFKVYWPLAMGVAPAPITIGQRQPILGQGRILLVDDEEVVRTTSAELLRHIGYEVVTASDGQEAVDYYRQFGHQIDLIIIDMVMPRLSGADCFRALKAIEPNIKAILTTGFGLNEAAQQLLDEGMAGFLQKPYPINELSEVVARALHHQE
jgi:CheY-like chemotaxis protein